jgi:hypothetical protein
MPLKVLAQDSLLAEMFVAEGAGEGSLPGVYPLVPGQVTPLREGLPAGIALIRPQPRVGQHVFVEHGLLGKGFLADMASEGFLTGVEASVDV